ncbi:MULTISPECIES: carboxymuconolactone decarboxylase family protein [Actinopolyspora]|uniref:Alkylhydroperoxidase AhpD family core domain-containing protein n=1 Tax=Actinopolyspora saharensis TaxID=995062 RepID=A0A1H1GIM8_9ACTN|nr:MULTISPECIES: carboxymuconolactone decarboxylase family protein [Actinopolyspora]NHD16592.1 carboxymuconolactone decarboxylase family protein [Actinopolyspora sp. BKK2]NHE75545.1 carboxymuconolactone decarboxylase family protein [Actinopolyspora sp. BKK1]SDR13005.1 alkylhydroperoxidase AhpD family core domain-containing protein [Actinopolyspora saharensis]
MTQQRMDLAALTPRVYREMKRLEEAVATELSEAGVEKEVYELVKIRASQLNGCGFCLDMHLEDARKSGVDEQRLDVLAAWREMELYSERERAALALSEEVTLIHGDGVSDETWRRAGEVFSETELAGLVWAATTINTWNRLAITSRAQPPRRDSRPPE